MYILSFFIGLTEINRVLYAVRINFFVVRVLSFAPESVSRRVSEDLLDNDISPMA